MARGMRLIGSSRPRPAEEPELPPPGTPIGDLRREIDQLQTELAHETDAQRAEALLGRLETLARKHHALEVSARNAAAAQRAEAAAAVARIGREQQRKARGLTLAQVIERHRQLVAQRQAALDEVDAIQREADALGVQCRQELPHLSARSVADVVWGTTAGAILRSRRETSDRQRYALEVELSELTPLLEPEGA